MKIIFNDRDKHICDTFAEVLKDWTNVEIRHCNFEDISPKDYEYLLTPGNSYGQMTGGFDLAVRNIFPHSEQEVQEQIQSHWGGMCPVGGHVLAGVGDMQMPMKTLIYTPTMRIPMVIDGTENVYWAYRQGMRVAQTLCGDGGRAGFFSPTNLVSGSPIRVLVPAFGTACGRVPAFKAANMLKLAVKHILREPVAASTVAMWNDHHEITKWV